MARRRGSGIDVFLMCPWWACAIAAVAGYCLLALAVPRVLVDPSHAVIASTARSMAPFVALGFAALGIGSAVRSFLVARRFESMVKDVQQPQPFIEPTNWGNRSNTTFGIADAAPNCPLCGQVMVLRAAKRGAKAGSQFWGCSGFPECRGARGV